MEPIKLLIADDHTIIRNGIKLMLNKNPEFEIVAEVNTGTKVIQHLQNNSDNVDVVLMDINMPEMNGIDATEIITKKYTGVKVLALTMHAEEAYITSMIEAGAVGYILKESDIHELTQAIKSTAIGKKYYSNEVSVTMINSLMDKGKSKGHDLSERELEVLDLIAAGLTNKEAGEKLFISPRTVETHRKNILEKLGFKNTVEMIRYAIENDLTK